VTSNDLNTKHTRSCHGDRCRLTEKLMRCCLSI